MATINAVKTVGQNRTGTVLWETITPTNSDGGGVDLGAVEHVTVQVLGGFTTAGRIDMEGSNDGGTTWAALADPFDGSDVQFAAAGLTVLGELPALVRPNLGAGSGAVDLDVYLSYKYKN